MKRFTLEEMSLLSMVEGKGRRIKFHPKATIVKGENDVGKSSLIKSIFWAFGAEPPDLHPDWKVAKITCLVKFSVAGEVYFLLRSEKFFALFDSKKTLIKTFNSVTNELGPVLSELFDFRIKLTSKQGEEITPPPAYYLLPFYVDQDSGWHQNWSSFERLGQIPNWRVPLIEYHTGIKANEYYVVKGQIDKIRRHVATKNAERRFFSETLEQFRGDAGDINLNLDVQDFKKDMDELLSDLKCIQDVRESYSLQISNCYNNKHELEIQIDITQRVLADTRSDYQLALNHNEIECPTCGHEYENSFSERFAIAEDEHKCAKMLAELNLELIETQKKLGDLQEKHADNEKEIADLEAVLVRKQGQHTLRDVIKNEGRKELKNILKEKIDLIDSEISQKEIQLRDLETERKKIEKEGKEKRKRIISSYIEYMRSYLHELDVKKLGQDSYGKISFKVNESGSDRPRALLAYYFSILEIMRQFSSSAFAPIIIDSPNQQDQDKKSIKKMLEFIKKRLPEDSQLILGLTDTHGVEYGGDILELKEKHNLLLKSEYKDVFNEINPLLDSSLLRN